MLLIFKVSISECDEGAQGNWEQQEDLQDFKENKKGARLQGNRVKSSHWMTIFWRVKRKMG